MLTEIEVSSKSYFYELSPIKIYALKKSNIFDVFTEWSENKIIY